MMKALFLAVSALALIGMACGHDPWMDQPTKIIVVAANIGQIPSALLDQYEQQNGVSIDAKGNHYITKDTKDRAQWDGYLGGVGAVGLDSNSFGPGGRPALITTDPFYLAMGARDANPDYLPEYLRGW